MLRTEEEKMRDYLYKALAIAERLCTEGRDAVAAKSQSALIGELHRFAWGLYQQSGKPVHRAKLMEFLSLRCDASRAMRMLELCCQMGWIIQQSDTLLFVPQARGLVTQQDSPASNA